MSPKDVNVLIIGVRRKCYKAAINLGYNTYLWSDEPLGEQRKRGLAGWIESSYSNNLPELSLPVVEFLRSNKITKVIANSEDTVILGALCRKVLGLKSLAIDVTQKFHDKFVMKNSALAADIPITKFCLINENTTLEDLVERLGLPVVIKPVNKSGAQDIKICRDNEELSKNLKAGLLAEAFVSGSEVSVETFVQNGKPIFHNITEYLHQWKQSVVPAQLEDTLKKRIIELNDRVIEHFGVDRGMTHSEFYLNDNGPVFGEIAIRPPGGYYMDLIEKVYGFDSWETYVKLGCGQRIEKLNQEASGCCAVVMFHPGAGKIMRIHGESEIQNRLEHIIEFNIRKSIGDVIPEHTNTSNEIGHILFWEESREKLNKSIDFVEKTLIIEIS